MICKNFSNGEISKSKNSWHCAMRSFENVNEELVQSRVWTRLPAHNRHQIAAKQKGEEGGEDESEEEESSECISHRMMLVWWHWVRGGSNTVTLLQPGKFILLWQRI